MIDETDDQTTDPEEGMKTTMVLEYLDHDLAGVLEHQMLTVSQIRSLARQLLLAIQHCHENHVIHRDIKGLFFGNNKEVDLKMLTSKLDTNSCKPFDRSKGDSQAR